MLVVPMYWMANAAATRHNKYSCMCALHTIEKLHAYPNRMWLNGKGLSYATSYLVFVRSFLCSLASRFLMNCRVWFESIFIRFIKMSNCGLMLQDRDLFMKYKSDYLVILQNWSKKFAHFLHQVKKFVVSFSVFCVEILNPEVALGQYFQLMTCQIEAEWDCYMSTIYRLALGVDKLMHNMAMQRQMFMVAPLHV